MNKKNSSSSKFLWTKAKSVNYQVHVISKLPSMTMINGQDTMDTPDVILTKFVNSGGEIVSQSSGYGPEGLCTVWTVKVPA